MSRLGFGILLVAIGAYVEGSVRGWPAFAGLAVALAGIFMTLTADQREDEPEPEPEHAIAGGGVKLIIAGSLTQAEVAAEKALGLERSQWRYVHFVQALEGATIDDVVLAMPITSYSQRYTEIVEEVGRIAERDGRKPDTVVFT